MAKDGWETVGSIRERCRWICDDLPDDLPARVVRGQDGYLSVEVLALGVAPHVEVDVAVEREGGRG